VQELAPANTTAKMGAITRSVTIGRFVILLFSRLSIYQIISACTAATMADRTYRRRLSLLLPKIERRQKLGKEAVFRADAAFAKPELYKALEERDVKYTIRLPANDHPQRNITELLTRPVGTSSPKPVARFKSFLYQAASWGPARRVVAKVAFHFGELSPRVGFIVNNLATSSRAVMRFYNKRGTLVADQLAAAAGENRRYCRRRPVRRLGRAQQISVTR